MEPIISPWLIYLIGISTGVSMIFELIGIIMFVVGGIASLAATIIVFTEGTRHAGRKPFHTRGRGGVGWHQCETFPYPFMATRPAVAIVA